MKRAVVAAVVALAGCDFPPPPRCHKQVTQVQYTPAHECTKMRVNPPFETYQGFCPEKCEVVTTCSIWCAALDQGKLEGHPQHAPLLEILPLNTARCDAQGRIVP